jgi:hypothetical protein
MIFESINLHFDVIKLQEHIAQHVLKLEPAQQSIEFGGWSVLSSNGNYQDGWHQGALTLKEGLTNEQQLQALQKMGAKRSSEYVIPTEICHGYLQEVINKISENGFEPKRARIMKLLANSASSWHRDAPDHYDSVRLHIPIMTNSECFFEISETERQHIPANGQAYLVRVNRLHRVVNGGPTDRYHLVMDVVDHNGISQFHRPQ